MNVRWKLSERYIATFRVVFYEEDELDARLAAHSMEEAMSQVLEEEDSLDMTQLIKNETHFRNVTPAEVVEQLRRSRDLLIMTKITQCFELAQQIDKIAWILEHRDEERFELNGYDHGAIFDRAKTLLGRRSG